MRSQLRLRVFLPVAVLGLLGIGVGAFAMGGPPGDSGAPLTTPTTTATTTQEEPADLLSRAAWAKQANKLCARFNGQIRALGQPRDVDEAVVFIQSIIEIAERSHRDSLALGWPKGAKALVLKSRALFEAQMKLAGQILEATKAGDQKRLLRLFNRSKPIARANQRINKRLGITRCNEDAFAPADPERGLAGALEENKVVVVLFYAPRSTYDAIQAREARSGAAAAGAGFLAVDVSKDRYVAALATAFEVRDAPAILVITRGFRVSARLDGFADRLAIAQAASNARL
jgi:hypothetical protein